MKTPLVTLLGRPNSGKSTLFNRLAGARIAIESEIPGTTRDRIFAKIETPTLGFFLVDTGGLEFGKPSSNLEEEVKHQAKLALDEADLILWVLEGGKEVTREDLQAAEYFRKNKKEKPVLLLVNKCDQPASAEGLSDFYRLGFSDPFPVSAIHNRGIQELEEKIVKILRSQGFKKDLKPKEKGVKVALLGRPNVGKSSLLNAILGEPRMIVSSVPGTTRDAADIFLTFQKKPYLFIDTAGLRRQSKRERGLEGLSALRTLRAIDRCDIACLLLEAGHALSHQDQQIANQILEAQKGLILVVNKEDLIKEKEYWIRLLQDKFPFLPWAPVVFTSAITGKNIKPLFDRIEEVGQERVKRIGTGALNRWIEEATEHFKPKSSRGIPKIFYATQTGIEPPTFVLFVNHKKHFHFSYLRYLENQLRERFGFIGTPIKFLIREKVRGRSTEGISRKSQGR